RSAQSQGVGGNRLSLALGFMTTGGAQVPDSTAGRGDAERFQRRFDLVAEGYDRPALRAFVTGAERLVDLASLRNGQVALDVATGTGHAAIAAARAVGSQGRVTAVDASGEMCQRAEQKALRRGLGNLEVRQGDGAALALPDASFDAVICASALY